MIFTFARRWWLHWKGKKSRLLYWLSSYSATTINFVCSNSFSYLRKVWSICDQTKTWVLIELIGVLVLSRVDYCYSLCYGLPNFVIESIAKIELCRAFDLSISTFKISLLKQLHCLSISQRIVFKVLLYAHQFIHQPGKLPLYLSELMTRKTRVTRSQYFYNLLFTKFCSNFVRRSLLHAVAVEWNKLSFDLKLITYKILFRRKLKTYLL